MSRRPHILLAPKLLLSAVRTLWLCKLLTWGQYGFS